MIFKLYNQIWGYKIHISESYAIKCDTIKDMKTTVFQYLDVCM